MNVVRLSAVHGTRRLDAIITMMPCKMKSIRRAHLVKSDHGTASDHARVWLQTFDRERHFLNKFKGGIIACTQRAGILVKIYNLHVYVLFRPFREAKFFVCGTTFFG